MHCVILSLMMNLLSGNHPLRRPETAYQCGPCPLSDHQCCLPGESKHHSIHSRVSTDNWLHNEIRMGESIIRLLYKINKVINKTHRKNGSSPPKRVLHGHLSERGTWIPLFSSCHTFFHAASQILGCGAALFITDSTKSYNLLIIK